MAKSKNRRKAPAQQPQGGFNRFLRDLHQALKDIQTRGLLDDFNKSSLFFKRSVYDWLSHINNPNAANEWVTPVELKKISVLIKRYYRESNLAYKSYYMSSYQLHLLMAYLYARAIEIERKVGVEDSDDAKLFRDVANKLHTNFYERFCLDCCRILTQLSNPSKKYYSFGVRQAALYEKNPRLDYVIDIYGSPAKKSMIGINGDWRPVYQISKIKFNKEPEWITVPTEILKDHYQGKKTMLEVYIQSHALNRLKERLDILDEKAINYALWENTCNISCFKSYKRYLLLPFKLFEIRIGYLVANIIDDKIIFRTFLFITHSCTPEGDKLRRITGLGKNDISYWKIDRLSTFIHPETMKNADFAKLLNDAGLTDLLHLNDKTFKIENMQIANLNGLINYIKQGRTEVLDPINGVRSAL